MDRLHGEMSNVFVFFRVSEIPILGEMKSNLIPLLDLDHTCRGGSKVIYRSEGAKYVAFIILLIAQAFSYAK